jgi:RNA polymerase sigma-70 factor, ECF subfamily
MLNFSTTTGGWLGRFPGKILTPCRDRQAEDQAQRLTRLSMGNSLVAPANPTHQTNRQAAPVNRNQAAMPRTAALSMEAYDSYQPGEPTSEARLIAQAKAGDQAAFAQLVEMHQDFVFNLAYRILQNYEEADDASQEAFVKIWQALAGFRGESKFTTWAYRIVRNSCLNRLRSMKGNPRLISVETNFEDGENGEQDILANLPGDQADEPAWHFDTNERRQLIWDQVDQLSVKYREIIALYYGQEMSYEEIAAALEVPVGTVKTHLYRAKAQLKTQLMELNNKGALDFGN